MSTLIERLSRLLAEATSKTDEMEHEFNVARTELTEAEALQQRAQEAMKRAIAGAERAEGARTERLRVVIQELTDLEKEVSRLRGKKS